MYVALGMTIEENLGCQSRQRHMAVSCYFLGHLFTASAQQTLSPAAAEGLHVHFGIGASTMPRECVPEFML